MYADLDFYVTKYLGVILPPEDFDRCATRASDYIDYITMGKAKTYNDSNDALAKCCCALAEQYYTAGNVLADVGAIASETVGSHSVSYRSSADVSASLSASLMSAVQMYLAPTGLLYRGVPCIRRIP